MHCLQGYFLFIEVCFENDFNSILQYKTLQYSIKGLKIAIALGYSCRQLISFV